MATVSRQAPYRSSFGSQRLADRDNLGVYLAVALGYIMLLPPQFNMSIGTSVLPPYRLLLIPATLYMLAKGARGQIRFGWADALIGIATAWVCFALFMTTEAVEAFTAVVAQTTDIAVAYFFGRFTLRTPRDLRMFLLLLLPGLVVLGLVMVAESLIGRGLVQDVASAITGKPIAYRDDVRLNLFRALGPFPHPILAGMFLSSFLPIYWLSGIRGWPKLAGVVATFMSFFSLSSAALLGLTIGTLLVVYQWLSERIYNLTWRLFFVVAGLFVFIAEAGTNSGTFSLIMRFASLNSVSSYNRVLIWKYGTQNVAAHPWFGIGYGDWERPDWMGASMDHFWLLTAVRFGILPSALLAIAVVLALVSLARSAMLVNAVDRRLLTGVAISLAVFAFGIVSVALWLSAHIWFFMLIGLSVSIAATVHDNAIATASANRRTGLAVERRIAR